jgi:ferritin-like metal-binding protein YciE
MAKMPMQTPQDLFAHELSDMLSAERIIVQMLGDAEGLVQNPQLRQGIQQHRQQSEQHIRNDEQVFQLLGLQPHKVECKAMKGLYDELKDVKNANPSAMVQDALVAGGAAKTEHYEIAGYTSLIEQARALGQTDAVRLLQQNLQQEEQMLREVDQIAQQMTQQFIGGAMRQGQQPSASQPTL